MRLMALAFTAPALLCAGLAWTAPAEALPAVSVHNGTPNGNRGGFSSPTLGAVISAHPQWSPNTAVTVYPNPN